MTDDLDDPVDILFGVQLGGGTDINCAVAYCQERITKPAATVVIVISDVYEGGVSEELVERSRAIVDSGATMIALLALSDSGAPPFDAALAARLSETGVTSMSGRRTMTS